MKLRGFPCGSVVKLLPAGGAGGMGSIPGLGRSLGGREGMATHSNLLA